MPAYDPRARYPSNQNRVSIPTLSGGVGRQAPSKRSVNEAENLDNVLVTLERSVEKRAGTNYIQRFADVDLAALDAGDGELGLFDTSADSDHFFAWFQISEEQRYLVVIDYLATNTNNLIKVFKVTKNGYYACTIPSPSLEYLEYLTYGNDEGNKAEDVLSVITIGPQLIILNKLVYAGYTSALKTFDGVESVVLETEGITVPADGDQYWCRIDYDGTFKTDANGRFLEDIEGRAIVYYTSIPVDPEGEATLYVEGKFYIKNDQVFTEVPSGTSMSRYLQKRYSESGDIEYAQIDRNGQNPYQWTCLEEDIPRAKTHFHLHQIEVIYDQNNPTPLTYDRIRLIFDQEDGRTKWLQADKFSLDGYDLPITPQTGPYDGYFLSDNGTDEWIIEWRGTTGAGNDGSNAHAIAAEFNSNTQNDTVVYTESYAFRGLITDFDMPQSLIDANILDVDNNLTADTFLVFNCIQEGIASGPVPSPSADAGEGEAAFVLRSDTEGGPLCKFIPVEDWTYPDPSKPYLGQNLEDFSEFNFPPKDNDILVSYDGDEPRLIARETINALYPDEVGDNQNGRGPTDGGLGKVYHVENSYAGESPGFYIVRNVEEKPYVFRVRTPKEYSVLDAVRFPKILKIDSFDGTTGIEDFVLENFNLEPRRAGTPDTNPGPQPFKDGQQIPIGSMALFRNRLFLSVGDTVFSSKLNDFSDFWIENPGSLTDKDPIETTLSTNTYAEVTTMTPFDSYLFINTDADTQFTMKGSENRITPFNAEVSPTAFYSTAPLVDPVLLGSQVYFFAPNRMYVYFSDATVSINQAIEVSLHCPNYLPSDFGQVTTIPGYDSVAMIDNNNRKFLYMYTNRYSGSNVTQNAFFRYVFDTDIYSVSSYDNRLFFVTRYEINSGTDVQYKYYLEYTEFYDPDINSPKLDHMIQISEADLLDPTRGTIEYDSGLGQTTITVNGYNNQNPNVMYIDVKQDDPMSGTSLNLASGLDDDKVISVGTNNGVLTVILNGDYTSDNSDRCFRFGTQYTMTIQLSPQFIRDEQANVIEGVFSMRTLHLRHANTGTYQVEKSVRGRRSIALTYSPQELDESNQNAIDLNMPLPSYEKDGESFTKILGYAAETDLFIVSDSSNPVNITQIEIKGKFKNRSSGFVR